MEPTLPRPNNLGSSGSAQEGAASLGATESNPTLSPERSGNAAPVVSQQISPVPQPIQAPDPSSIAPPIASVPQPTLPDDPQIADDVDVIEKEWVDKAKKIVSATKEDPHQQEKEVNKLQADYLMKRYNKKMKISE